MTKRSKKQKGLLLKLFDSAGKAGEKVGKNVGRKLKL